MPPAVKDSPSEMEPYMSPARRQSTEVPTPVKHDATTKYAPPPMTVEKPSSTVHKDASAPPAMTKRLSSIRRVLLRQRAAKANTDAAIDTVEIRYIPNTEDVWDSAGNRRMSSVEL